MPVFSALFSFLRARRAYRRSLLPLIVAPLLLPPVAARAQVASFSGSPSLVNGIGNLFPTGVAVDAGGHIYVANSSGGGTANEILKITPGGSSSVLSLGGNTLQAAYGLAVDGAGYLYIVDSPQDGNTADNRVLKVKTDGSSASVIPAGTLNDPTAVTVDASGNVYIADNTIGTSARVVKVPFSGGAYGSPVNFVSATEAIGSEGVLEYVTALAMDASGNVLLTDDESSGARLITVTSSGAASELISSTQSIGAGGTLFTPYGVAADAQGDIFIADEEASDGLGRIVELPFSVGSYGSPLEYVSSATNILNTPNGLAIDSEGNLYATDFNSDAENPSGSGGVIEIATQSMDFGSISVGSSSATYSLNFVFHSTSSLNATTPYEVLTLGASGLDFAPVTSGTSCSGSLSAGGTCTVKVKFTPRYAGLRMGAVELVSSSGSVIATAYVRGNGTGPQVVFSPGTQSTLGGGFSGPVGVAVDGSGNVYVGDSSSGAVKEIPVGCATSSCVTTLGGGFGSPSGVAVDGSGNLYVADYGNTAVDEIPAGCVTSSCVMPLGGGFSGPNGVTVDAIGNVYVADTDGGAVDAVPAGCLSSSCVTTLGVGFAFGAPTGVAVDASGNVYVADQANSAVYEIPASCIAGANNASCVTMLGGDFSFPYPYGVTVDGNGNVYVADWGSNAVYEMPAGCASSTCVTTLDGSFSNPVGVAVDGSGNVYASNSSNDLIVGLGRSDAPSLSFGSTNVGQTTSAQTVTLANIGNMALTFPVPSTGNNPSVAANFALGGATTCPELDPSSSEGTLAAGASCTLAVEFAPTDTGSIAGSLIVKDNHLNAAAPNYTTQSISLSGTGQAVVPGAPTIGTVTPGNGQATVNFTPPSSDGGAAITSYRATSIAGGKTGTCAASPCTVTGLTNGTAYSFKVTATNSVGTGSASAASASVTPQAPQTITFNNPGTQNFGTSPTLTATASSGLTVTFSSTTTGVCTVTSGGSLTFVSTGTCTINANQAGNSAYAAAAQVLQSFTVAAVVPGTPTIGAVTAGNAQATVSFTPPSSNGGASITSYTATSSPGGMTGSCAASPCTVTGLTNGTAYAFTVTATNSVGAGSASAASGSVTPQASQTITFNTPGTQNFGTSPTLTATASSGLTVTFSSSTTAVCTVTSGGALTFVSAGTCSINANQAGNSAYSAAAQVSQLFTVAAVVPGAPTIVTLTANAVTGGGQEAMVNFTAPVFTGGAAITGYTATSNPGGITGICASSPCVVTGLTSGSTYTFTVTATNAAGTGAASAASNTLTIPIPNLVVTTAADDASTASSCTPQSSTTTGTDAACTLRDALLYAASAGAANISFDSTAFAATNTAAQNTITLGSAGTLTIPTNTAVTGATSGSGATRTNLVTVSGNNAYTVFTVNSGVSGAVIANLTITKGNSGFGGGIDNSGTLTVTGSTFSGDTSSNSGGGVYNNASSTLTVTGSTFSGNSATMYGGGIYNGASSTLTLTDSTFFGNSTSIYDGGGIQNSGTVTGSNITVSGNTSGRYGGGIEEGGGSSLTLSNSIVAGNSANSQYADVGATSFTNNGGNQASNSTSTTSTTNAGLAPLGSYGGPTQTMIPLPGSVAICAGLSSLVPSGTTTDQRGVAMGAGGYCPSGSVDAGAVQTNYSLAFMQQPPSALVQNATMTPAPAVQLNESGSPFTTTVTIPLTLNATGSGTLNGGSGATSASTGVATYSTLSVSAPGTGDSLTANLILNAAITPVAPAVSVASTTFTVTSSVTQLAFSTAPAAGITSGGNAGAEITVEEEAADHTVVTTAADTITLTVTGPNSYSQSYTATAVSGVAAFNLSSAALTTAGSYQYTATSGSLTEATAPETVNAASASTISLVSGSGQSAVIGTAFANALKVKVLDNYGNPISGATVTFLAPASGAGASFSSSTATTGSDGTAIATATANGIASTIAYTVSANVSGVSSQASFTLTNTQRATTLTITPGATALAYGQSVTVNAAISPASVLTSTPTGSIIFYDGGIAFTPNATVAGSAANYVVSVPAVGSHIYAAQYQGDANFSASTQTNAISAVMVGKAASTLIGPSSPVMLNYGNGGSIAISVSGQFSGTGIAQPSGNVSYTIGSGTAQTAVISNGAAALTIPVTQGAGTYNVLVSYGGDSNYNAASTSSPIRLNVGQAVPSINWAPVATIGYGTNLSGLLTATSTFNSQNVPGTFSYMVQAGGGAAFPVTAATVLPAGGYMLTANFTPTDPMDYKSTSASFSVTVTDALLTAAANNAMRAYGTPNPAFTGNVTGALNGDRFTESFTTAASVSSNVGAYAIVPSAAGVDLGNYTETIQNGALTVTQAGSAVTLTSSTADTNLNANVTFTATVTSATTGTPTGIVEFLDGSIVLASSELNAQGVATYSTTNLAEGAHSIHVLYAGDQNFTGSSIALAQQVAAPDYSLTADPASLTLKAGQTGEVTFTFAPVGGYTGTVSFACTGLPADVSCSFAPSSLTADGSNRPQTSQLTITTKGPNTGTISANESDGAGRIAAGSIFWLPGLLLGSFLLWQRKKLSASTRQLLGMLILVAAICWATGCGFEPPQAPGGAHMVTVTATASASGSDTGSGAASHTATFTLTITQ